MEEKERCRSRSPARRTSRVQQVVGTIIRRTRESLSRERLLGDGGRSQRSNSLTNQSFVVKLTVTVTRDPVLDGTEGHGFTLTQQHPLVVRDVTADGPAEGLLYPGDQVVQINDIVADDANLEQLDNILSDLEDSITMTILRHMTNPKSSIMSAEKRARLRNNPVKVRFAEEVVVNGHTQGNSLLFLPNVLKVYLENGQTKAFKFDHTTTVKDIVATLKDKLSIKAIEYFSLVLEQQYSITKLLLLHEDELIIKVVQKKDSHDYRCLFRVCFLPRDPADLLHDDPSAFEYLFLQSVGDVLQERFAVEMKCNTALRLAALHMHERLDTCGQTRASIKSITKEFGLDSFISPTLLSNMREKDLRKAINHHLKKIQALLEPRQKVISANQARLAYLTQLGELISYGGRSYSATMMLQDREAPVSLLVGSRYGMSQVINPKLNMISTLVEFSSISKVELLSESDKVSLLRISLHDMKPFALLMDSLPAKDLGCLLAGYCRLLVDPGLTVFRLGRPKVRVHRIVPAEEGYVSRCCSDSNDSSDEDYPMETQSSGRAFLDQSSQDWEERRREVEERRREEERRERDDNAGKQEVQIVVTVESHNVEEEVDGGATGSDASREDQGTSWYHTDPRVTCSFSSLSSGSLSAALEDSSSTAAPRPRPLGEGPNTLDVHHPYLLEPQCPQRQGQATAGGPRPTNLNQGGKDSCLCFTELSQTDLLPSPPEATSDDDTHDDDDEEEEEEEAGLQLRRISKIPSSRDLRMIDNTPFPRLSPNSLRSNKKLPPPREKKKKVPPKVPLRSSSIRRDPAPFLTPSPPHPATAVLLKEALRDSESEDEFFDAQDRFTPPVPDLTESELADRRNANRLSGSWNGLPAVPEKDKETSSGSGSPLLRTPGASASQKEGQTLRPASSMKASQPQPCSQKSSQPQPSLQKTSQSQPSSQRPEVKTKPPLGPKPQLPPKPQVIPPRSPQRVPSGSPQRAHPGSGSPQRAPPGSGSPQQGYAHCNGDASSGRLSSELLEMEPDTMEVKSVRAGPPGATPLITAVRRSQHAAPPPPQEKSRTVENGPKQDNGPRVVNANLPASPRPPALPSIPRSSSGSSLGLILPPPTSPKPNTNSLHPLSLPASSPVSPTDPLGGGVFSPSNQNGLLLPWGSRNGSGSSAVQPGSRRVSLSHESLSPKNSDAPLSLTTSLTSTSARGLDGKDPPGRSGSGSDLRSGSVSSLAGGRLPCSALRGRIQALPWYMTRSQEILGTLDYPASSGSINGDTTSGFGSGLSVASGASDLKEKVLDDGAEVVIATFKETQEVTSHAATTRANGTTTHETNLNFKQRGGGGAGVVSSEQPQSRPHSAVGLGGVSASPPAGGGGDSETTPPGQHREACGCRTVYANCFSGSDAGAEEGVGFDEELTVYEFSRRTQRPKPAPAAGPSPTAPPPNPNILSLLRDTPRPLSALSPASTELSPLVASPRPVSPSAPALHRPVSPAAPALHSLSNKRYGGLKGGFASLRHDIEQLLLLLERGTSNPNTNPQEAPDPNHNHTGVYGQNGGGDFRDGGSLGSTTIPGSSGCCGGLNPGMTEAERSLLQTEARRLASGCQRATRVGWAPDEALRSLSNSFSALVQLSAACLRTSCPPCPPCPGCPACRGAGGGPLGGPPGGPHPEDLEEAREAMDKMKEIVGLYRDFVGAVETAGTGGGAGLVPQGGYKGLGGGGGTGQGGEGEGVRLLAKRCTVLISSVFALTQLFRTRSVDTAVATQQQATPPGQVPLHF